MAPNKSRVAKIKSVFFSLLMLCFCEFQVSDWDRGTNWALQATRVLWGISGEQKGCCVFAAAH